MYIIYYIYIHYLCSELSIYVKYKNISSCTFIPPPNFSIMSLNGSLMLILVDNSSMTLLKIPQEQ